MDALLPIQLPYGSSALHRHVRETGKNVALPLGGPKFRLLSLRELTATIPSSNLPDSHFAPDRRPHKHIAGERHEMGIPRGRKTIELPIHGAAKKGRPYKSSIQINLAPQKKRQNSSLATKKLHNPSSSPGDGEKRHTPIVIEDSDDEFAANTGNLHLESSLRKKRRVVSQSNPSPRTCGWLKDSIRPTATAAPDPSYYRFASSPPDTQQPIGNVEGSGLTMPAVRIKEELPSRGFALPSRKRHPSEESVVFLQEKSASISKPQCKLKIERSPSALLGSNAPRNVYPTPARSQGTPQRNDDSITLRSDHPTLARPAREPNERNASNKVRATPNESSKAESNKSSRPVVSKATPALPKHPWYTSPAGRLGHQGMTLADIPDFRLRMKVAQLMAIAPTIAIQELYNLLVDVQVSYDDAKTILTGRTSQTPKLHTSLPNRSRPTSHLSTPRPARDAHDHEMGGQQEDGLVKIDYDDPELWMDNDVPSSPPPPTPRPKKAGSKKNSKAQSKSIAKQQAKRKAGPEHRKKTPPTSKVKSSSSARVPSSGGKKSPANGSQSRRSNSIEGRFVIPDDDSLSDRSYTESISAVMTESEESGSDVIMEDEDEDDLDIDM